MLTFTTDPAVLPAEDQVVWEMIEAASKNILLVEGPVACAFDHESTYEAVIVPRLSGHADEPSTPGAVDAELEKDPR